MRSPLWLRVSVFNFSFFIFTLQRYDYFFIPEIPHIYHFAYHNRGISLFFRPFTLLYIVYIKHKDTKKRSFSLATKTTSDLKVATKACCVKNFVAFVKSSFAALCIFHHRKKKSLFLRVFVFNKKEKLSLSVPLCLKIYQPNSHVQPSNG